MDQRFIMTCNQILPAIVAENPNYKDQVGTVLYEFVNQLVGIQPFLKVQSLPFVSSYQVQHLRAYFTRIQIAQKDCE